MRALRVQENVVCKLSGIVPRQTGQSWTVEDLRPYAESVLEAFGPSAADVRVGLARLHARRHLQQVVAAAKELTASLSAREREGDLQRDHSSDVYAGVSKGAGMSVTQRAIDEIKAMIIGGELAAGERLPKEADLAARLGISRNSLREAVRALTLASILEARQGDGTYVTWLEPSMLLEPLTFMADFHQDRTLLHVLEVRRILEAAVGRVGGAEHHRRGARRAARDRRRDRRLPAVDAFVANDLRFHRIVGTRPRKPILASVLDSFPTPMSRTRVWRGVTQANPESSRPRGPRCSSTKRCAHRGPTWRGRWQPPSRHRGVAGGRARRPPSLTRSLPESSGQSPSPDVSSCALSPTAFRRETSDQSLDKRSPPCE